MLCMYVMCAGNCGVVAVGAVKICVSDVVLYVFLGNHVGGR